MDLEVGGRSGYVMGTKRQYYLKNKRLLNCVQSYSEVKEDNNRNVTIGVDALVRGLSEVVDKPH